MKKTKSRLRELRAGASEAYAKRALLMRTYLEDELDEAYSRDFCAINSTAPLVWFRGAADTSVSLVVFGGDGERSVLDSVERLHHDNRAAIGACLSEIESSGLDDLWKLRRYATYRSFFELIRGGSLDLDMLGVAARASDLYFSDDSFASVFAGTEKADWDFANSLGDTMATRSVLGRHEEVVSTFESCFRYSLRRSGPDTTAAVLKIAYGLARIHLGSADEDLRARTPEWIQDLKLRWIASVIDEKPTFLQLPTLAFLLLSAGQVLEGRQLEAQELVQQLRPDGVFGQCE